MGMLFLLLGSQTPLEEVRAFVIFLSDWSDIHNLWTIALGYLIKRKRIYKEKL